MSDPTAHPGTEQAHLGTGGTTDLQPGQSTHPPQEAPRLPPQDGSQAIRIPPDLATQAAARLLGASGGTRGRRMVSAAALQGIDLSLMWGTLDQNRSDRPSRVRQVCLAVPGSGRTAMLMLSPPAARRENPQDHHDRVACLRATCEGLAEADRAGDLDIRLAQALPEPRDAWAVAALREAAFVKVGDLAYLRAPLKDRGAAGQVPPPEDAPWPAGVEVRHVRGAAPGEPDREALITALDRSYIDTLDCPELCGLRDTADILDSHRATGVFDPALWWLVLLNGEPHGCMLLNHLPDHSCVELVYVGLSPQLRGKGLGGRLLRTGLARVSTLAADHIACAVDLRNVPARQLYEHLGFTEFGRRVALVRPIAGCP